MKQALESEQLLLLLELINQSQETNKLLAFFLEQQSQGKTDMKLLKAILETVTEKLLDICDGAVNLFEKGCEPESLGSIWKWLNKPSVPTREIDPIVPYGGF